MLDNSGKLIVGLAATVGAALLVFARKHGAEVELPPELAGEETIARAQLELQRWHGLKETDALAAPLLARYWASVGMPPQAPDVPWSAAFISYVAAPNGLQPSGSHIGYARAALKARTARDTSKYWAFAPNESGILPVRPGDILINGRGQPVSWADVATDTGHKDAHGSLVTYAAGGVTSMIGGNVSNGVTQTDVAGLPAGVFAIVRKPTAGGLV